jgi:hypothetical protein
MEFRYGLSIFDPLDFTVMQTRVSNRQRHGPVRPIFLTKPISINSTLLATILKVEVQDAWYDSGDESARQVLTYLFQDGHYNPAPIGYGSYAIVGGLPKLDDLHSWGYAMLQDDSEKIPNNIDSFLILFSHCKLNKKLTVGSPSQIYTTWAQLYNSTISFV